MTTYWETLPKSATDNEQIEEAIARILALHDFGIPVAVWGMMPKTQSDNETISEAIDAAIAAHEADSAAHLGAGESLLSHKASEIIDHAVGSIVADKYTMQQLSWETGFETLDKWIYSGNVANLAVPGVNLTVEYGGTEISRMCSQERFFQKTLTFTKSAAFEAQVMLSLDSTIVAWFGVGDFYNGYELRGIAFKLVDDALYGYVNFDGTVHTVDLDTVLGVTPSFLRAEFDVTSGYVVWFVNGVEKGSHAVGTPTSPADYDISARIEASDGAETILTLQKIKAVLDI